MSPDPNASANERRAPLPAMVVATFFGSGLSPKAPGTMGSLASLVLWGPLVAMHVPWWMRFVATAAIFLVGTWAAAAIVRARGREDPQIVVVDEVAGMGVTLLVAGWWGAPTWLTLALGFGLFRLFDIWKPWPVRVADRKVKGGFGVMLDDVLAGGYALACLSLLEAFVLPRLF
jgi:phosphatidylglycerophosphatase A